MLISIFVGLVGAFAGYKLAQRNQSLRQRQKRYHAIYNLLIDLNTQFELLDFAYHRGDASEANKLHDKIILKKYEINDELRYHDVDLDIEIAAKALLKYKEHTFEQRRKEIDDLCEYFGKKVNKKHWILMHEISEENKAFVAKHKRLPKIP